MIRVAVGYPSRDDEWGMARRRLERKADEVELGTVIDGPGLLEMQRAVEDVHISEAVGRYIVDVVRATRESARLQVGSSPRGTLALIKLTRCRAALRQRDYVVPDDVKALAAPVLAHRLTLQPELWVQQVSPQDIVEECVQSVPTPAAEDITPPGSVIRTVSPKLVAYAALAGGGLLAALATRRPELAIVTLPFSLFFVAVLRDRDPGDRRRVGARAPAGAGGRACGGDPDGARAHARRPARGGRAAPARPHRRAGDVRARARRGRGAPASRSMSPAGAGAPIRSAT